MLLHGILDSGILQSFLQLHLANTFNLLSNHTSKLVLHSCEDAADLALGVFGGQLKRNMLLFRHALVVILSFFPLCFLLLSHLLVFCYLMLSDVLGHNLVIELQRVLVGQVVVKLASLRLNHVALVRARDVSKPIVLGALHVVAHDCLVAKCSIFLFNEAFRRRVVALDILGAVKVSHHLVEVIHFEVFSLCRRDSAVAFSIKDSFELFLNRSSLSL